MAEAKARFGLARRVIGSAAFLALSEQEYRDLLAAKAFVVEVLALEEKWDLVVGNHLDLEKALNELAAEQMVQASHDYHVLNDARVLVNRRVMNLLAACRLYLDHGPRHAQNVEAEIPDLQREFERLTHTQFDQSRAYRIAELLRNHAQHNGFPIGTISIGARLVERPNSVEALLYRVEAHLDIEALIENTKNRAATREELKGLGKNDDARPILREYVGRLSAIHQAVRQRVEESLGKKEGSIESSIKRYRDAFPAESTLGLAAVELDQAGRFVSETEIFVRFIERRRHLSARNGNLERLTQWHVSSEPDQ